MTRLANEKIHLAARKAFTRKTFRRCDAAKENLNLYSASTSYTFVHMNSAQIKLFKTEASSHGGDLMTTRKGRARGRPLATKEAMHLVLRSTRAVGNWSFQRPNHKKTIRDLIARFAKRHGVRVFHIANVGNHLHLQIQLGHRRTYAPFIRGLTSAIAMAVTGRNRWSKSKEKLKFWDRRPFTRILRGRKSWLILKDYIQINQLEVSGLKRHEARWIVQMDRSPPAPP